MATRTHRSPGLSPRTAWLAYLGVIHTGVRLSRLAYRVLFDRGGGPERDPSAAHPKALESAAAAAPAEALEATQPGQSVPVQELPAVTKALAGKLRQRDIQTSAELLSASASVTERRGLARELLIPENRLLALAHQADLARVEGLGKTYVELLSATGVLTVKDLATRNPTHLREDLQETNDRNGITNRLPTEETLEDWISQAGRLPRALHY